MFHFVAVSQSMTVHLSLFVCQFRRSVLAAVLA